MIPPIPIMTSVTSLGGRNAVNFQVGLVEIPIVFALLLGFARLDHVNPGYIDYIAIFLVWPNLTTLFSKSIATRVMLTTD